jgi:hypothetical protein
MIWTMGLARADQSGSSIRVMVFFVALALFRKNRFEPTGLLVSEPFIHERRLVENDELFPTAVTPEGTHLFEALRFPIGWRVET